MQATESLPARQVRRTDGSPRPAEVHSAPAGHLLQEMFSEEVLLQQAARLLHHPHPAGQQYPARVLPDRQPHTEGLQECLRAARQVQPATAEAHLPAATPLIAEVRLQAAALPTAEAVRLQAAQATAQDLPAATVEAVRQAAVEVTVEAVHPVVAEDTAGAVQEATDKRFKLI